MKSFKYVEPVAIALIEFPNALLSLKYPSFTDRYKKPSNSVIIFSFFPLLFLMTFSPSDTQNKICFENVKWSLILHIPTHPTQSTYPVFRLKISLSQQTSQQNVFCFVCFFLAHRKSQPPPPLKNKTKNNNNNLEIRH